MLRVLWQTLLQNRVLLLITVVLWAIFSIYYEATAITEVPAGRQCLEPTQDMNVLTSTLIEECACVSPKLNESYFEPLSLAVVSCVFPRKCALSLPSSPPDASPPPANLDRPSLPHPSCAMPLPHNAYLITTGTPAPR